MTKNKFNSLIEKQFVELKYMYGKAATTEAVTIYKDLPQTATVIDWLNREIISQKKAVNVLFYSGPWKGKEFLFTKNEIK